MKSAGKARNDGLYRHIRTSKEIIRNLLNDYDNIEILIDNKRIRVSSKGDIIKLTEAGSMTVRGFSKILEVPMMVTFLNQINTVNVSVAQMTDEFETADYQRFNMSLGQYMDSIELSMYR